MSKFLDLSKFFSDKDTNNCFKELLFEGEDLTVLDNNPYNLQAYEQIALDEKSSFNSLDLDKDIEQLDSFNFEEIDSGSTSSTKVSGEAKSSIDKKLEEPKQCQLVEEMVSVTKSIKKTPKTSCLSTISRPGLRDSRNAKRSQKKRIERLKKLSFYPHKFSDRKPKHFSQKLIVLDNAAKEGTPLGPKIDSKILVSNEKIEDFKRSIRIEISKKRAKPSRTIYDRAMVSNSIMKSQNFMNLSLLTSTLAKSRAVNSVGGSLCSRMDTGLLKMMHKVHQKEERYKKKAVEVQEAKYSSYLSF